jgi:putative transcriptional regulator
MIEITTVEMLLMNYAAGSLNAAESMVMAAHIALNPDARRKFQEYEAMGGRLIETALPVQVTSGCLDSVMQRIGLCVQEKSAPPRAQGNQNAPITLPDCIEKLIDGNCTERAVTWKTLAEGVESFDLRVCTPVPCGRRLRLLRIKPHARTPAHRHHGREITVILNGSYSDEHGIYKKGDMVVITDDNHSHTPAATAEGCVCIVLTDAPLRFSDPLYRMMNIFFRI